MERRCWFVVAVGVFVGGRGNNLKFPDIGAMIPLKVQRQVTRKLRIKDLGRSV